MKKIICLLLVLTISLLQFMFVSASAGSLVFENGFYLIDSADDLYAFADLVNNGESSANAKLTRDIIVNENVLNADGELNEGAYREWYPVGDKNTYARINGASYDGIFDGQNYSIYGLYYASTDDYRTDSGIGLFGTVNSGTVRNVNIKDSYIEGMYHIGSVCSILNSGSIIGCNSFATVKGSSNVAGICAYGDKEVVLISRCNFYGKASAQGARVAGISARLDFCNIEYCNNYGTITGSNSNVAGVIAGVGDYDYVSTIKDCSNYGNVYSNHTSYIYTGGITSFATNTTIEDCLNAGTVSATTSSFVYCGGIAGYGFGTIKNCLSVGELTITNANDRNNIGGVFGSATNSTKYKTSFKNNYFLTDIAEYGVKTFGTSSAIASEGGIVEAVSGLQLKDGTVWALLDNNRTKSPWVQVIGTDNHPVIEIKPIYFVDALGGSIRVFDGGFRFGFSFNDLQGAQVEEYGFIYAYSQTDDLNISLVGTDGVKKKIADNRIDWGDYITYNLVFTGMPKSAYDTVVSARAYVKVQGEYYYSPILQRSFNIVANAILADETVDQITKDAINNLLKEV